MAEAVAAPLRDVAGGGGRLRKDQKHLLLGRAGEGPPIAPPGWGWRAGSRARDMYFYSPSGDVFRSHVQLNTYLASHPGSPSASEFWWTFKETDFQEGPLPGTPVDRRRDAAQNKKQKLQMEEKDDDHHSSAASPRASTPTTSGQLSPASKHRSKKEAGLNSILSSPTGHRVLLRNSGAMRKFLEEAAQLGKKSEAEIGELRDILLVKSQDLMTLRKYPKNALRVFFYLLRNEEAPSCFGVTELSDLCNSWLCKHMRPWCLREAHRIQTLAETLQRQAQKKLVEQETMPGGQTVAREANGTACGTNEMREIGDASDVVDLDDANQQEQPSVVGERCKCKACCTNPSFCSGCECNICKDVVHTKENWSYLKCEKCSHVCHLDCALEARRAGVVKDSGLDVEFLCPSCLQKTDLTSFWKDRIKDALAVVDRGLLEKHLLAAVRVMAGTEKSAYQAIHARVGVLHNAIVHDADCPPDFHELLRQIGDPLRDLQLQHLGDCDDKFLDQSLLAEILEEDPIHSIQVEEAKVAEYQKQAEQDYVLWLKAEKHADARRSLVKQITQQLEKAEEEVKLRADCAASSRMLLQKSQKKLQLLEQIRGAQGISKERMQLQRSIFNRELSELQILQDKVVSLKPETWDGYLSQLSVLLEAMKSQRKRVEVAQERLEGLIALHKLVKQ